MKVGRSVRGSTEPSDADAHPRPGRRTSGPRERLSEIGRQRFAGLVTRVDSSLPARCFRRFILINGRDRVLVLGGQAFTTIIPLLIVVAGSASRQDPDAFADRMTHRFHVSGSSAQAVRILFERPPGATGAITVAGFVVLVLAVLSLTSSLQRTYEAAWQLPALGLRGILHSLTATGLLVTSLLVLSLVARALRHLPAGTALVFVLRTLAATVVWLILQSLLLSRRVPIRHLLPGAIVAGVGQAVLSLYSALWMPHLIQQNADRYGIIGVTFAILTWLIAICFCIVVAAVLSAEMGGATRVSGEPGSIGRSRATVGPGL